MQIRYRRFESGRRLFDFPFSPRPAGCGFFVATPCNGNDLRFVAVWRVSLMAIPVPFATTRHVLRRFAPVLPPHELGRFAVRPRRRHRLGFRVGYLGLQIGQGFQGSRQVMQPGMRVPPYGQDGR